MGRIIISRKSNKIQKETKRNLIPVKPLLIILMLLSFFTHHIFIEGNIVNAAKSNIVLKKGMRHVEVKSLKSDLGKIGFTVPGNGTTLFGSDTEKKVKEFQKYYKLAADGIVGKSSFAKIDSILKSPLQKGKRHKDTQKLKKDLASIGYKVPGNETTLFGADTEKVVKKFQKDKGLVVNGIADEITLVKIAQLSKNQSKPTNPSTLRNGDRHALVKDLKRDLKKLGFTVPGNGTSLFGSDTEKKVKEFQRYYKLAADGIVGKSTFDKIDSILKSPLQNGKRHNNTKKLKNDLAKIGYKVPGNGTTLFGADTEKIVKKFQKDYKLVVNGIADEITLAKIAQLNKDQSKPTNPSTLRNGDRHALVKDLKRDLKKLGFTVPGNGTTLFGSDTEKKVKEFQKYYKLAADGIVGKSTFDKIDSILKSPLQNGKRHNNTKKLKNDLAKIGYKVPGNGTTLFGADTEKIVKKFQKDYKLVVNGIADEVTLAKISELIKAQEKPTIPKPDPNPSVLKKGVRHAKVKTLKSNLKKIGFTVPGNGTTYYGEETAKKVEAFQRYYRLSADGMAGPATLAKVDSIIKSPLQKGKRHNNTKKLKKDLAKIGYKVPGTGTNLYGADTEKIVKKFQKDKGLVVNGIADEITLAKIASLQPSPPTTNKKVKFFIDAGHGGSDPGAGGNGLNEKDLTLDIAKRIEKYLKQYKDVELKMSRTNDKRLELYERVKLANDWKADYFVSVHINSFTDPTANGFESFVHNSNKVTKEDKEKQKIIHNHIAQNIDERDRGTKEANFHVLRETNMPAILFEYMFITNKDEAKLLKDSKYRDKLAKLTAEGIAKAFKLEKK